MVLLVRHRFRCIWSLLTEDGIVRARDDLLTALRTLLDTFRAAGWDEPSLHKLCHGNWLRVLGATWH